MSKLYSVVSKICVIGFERDLRAAALRRAGDLDRRNRIAPLVALLIDLAVAPDLQIETLGERIHDRHANTVQTAGYLVRGVLEFAARVQHGQDDFGRRTAVRHRIDRNAAPVVDDGDRVVDVDGDVDLIAEARERLVDRVVDDFVHQVMQPRLSGRPDVHGGALAHRFEALEDLDLVCAVIVS